MKTSSTSVLAFGALVAFFLMASRYDSLAQASGRSWPATNSPYSALDNPALTNIPGAVSLISRVLAQPTPAPYVPEVTNRPSSPPGSYFSLALPYNPPLPGNCYPAVPVYALNSNVFVMDDRGVDWAALAAQREAQARGEGWTFGNPSWSGSPLLDTNTTGLWLEVPPNEFPDTNSFDVVLHNTVAGEYYDLLTKTDLLLTNWSLEQSFPGSQGSTPQTVTQNGRTNLFVWARQSIIPVLQPPIAQEVLTGDTVTFAVTAVGSDLSYQWTFDGTNIVGATSSTLTLDNVSSDQAGEYAVVITSATGSVTTPAVTLTVDPNGDGGNPNPPNGDPFSMAVLGQRQNYVFKNGVTYYIGEPAILYGNTTIEAGAIIKFDYTGYYPCLQIMGTLTCLGTPYNPSILTTIDDNTYGESWAYSTPQPVFTGAPYLDLTGASNCPLRNLRFRYADQAVSTPYAGRLDVWHTQFFQCNAAVVNLFGGVDAFHNVLFAGCEDMVGAYTNAFAVQAEHITADVGNVWQAPLSPFSVALTNSIIHGNLGSATLQNTVANPDTTNFQSTGAGYYYLAPGSSFHQSGSTNVSPALLSEFQQKTTFPPVALPATMTLAGNLTLFPQATRYTNGPPDLGYYYDALDYLASALTNFGTITVEPGTAIGLYNQQDYLGNYTIFGFDLRENSSFVAHGTPNRPIIFADVQLVQDQDAFPCSALFLPDFESTNSTDSGPLMDFRFCESYAGAGWYQVQCGLDDLPPNFPQIFVTPGAVLNWTMQDCQLYNGNLSLGLPYYGTFLGSGNVVWNNNLFENVQINLGPDWNWYDGSVQVDLAFSARNNLFRRGTELELFPCPASSGNWVFEDNLFDQVEFYQDPYLPLDFDHNGYWPASAAAIWWPGDFTELQPTTPGDGTTNGAGEVVLSARPAYRAGPFGKYYLSGLNALYQAGSRTAGAAGLAQSTTLISQTKEAATQPVSIGLHYVAAANRLPLDTDGDGIPDYKEDANGNGVVDANETSWLTQYTVPGVFDPTNSVYDDVDLSGDGLVGRIKSALRLNALDANNPLTIKKIITGDEPDIATFELPISYTTLSNIGGLNLNLNGIDVILDDFGPAEDGNTLLSWNTCYDPPGQAFLQAQVTLFSSDNDNSITSGVGCIVPYYSSNLMQFFESDSMFDNTGAYLDAELVQANAAYSIQLFDPSTSPPTLIKTITNSTSDGFIHEDWDLSWNDGISKFSGDTINAVFSVYNINPGTDTHIKIIHKLTSTEQGNNFDFAYMYTPTNNTLYQEFESDIGAVFNLMQGVVNTIMMPLTAGGGSENNYNSYFNVYSGQNFAGQDGYPGFVPSQSVLTNNLFPDLANGVTRNFYCYSHGSGNALCSFGNNVLMTSYQISALLGNNYATKGGLNTQNPYRFVFLDGCSTASQKNWRRAFGIYPLDAMSQAGRNHVGPQAYVGWANDHVGWFNGVDDSDATVDIATGYGNTLNAFYFLWMNNVPLKQCIDSASTVSQNYIPLPVPQYKNGFVATGEGYYGDFYNLAFTNVMTSKIYVVGHSGLTRGGVNPNYDGFYSAPVNSE